MDTDRHRDLPKRPAEEGRRGGWRWCGTCREPRRGVRAVCSCRDGPPFPGMGDARRWGEPDHTTGTDAASHQRTPGRGTELRPRTCVTRTWVRSSDFKRISRRLRRPQREGLNRTCPAPPSAGGRAWWAACGCATWCACWPRKGSRSGRRSRRRPCADSGSRRCRHRRSRRPGGATRAGRRPRLRVGHAAVRVLLSVPARPRGHVSVPRPAGSRTISSRSPTCATARPCTRTRTSAASPS